VKENISKKQKPKLAQAGNSKAKTETDLISSKIFKDVIFIYNLNSYAAVNVFDSTFNHKIRNMSAQSFSAV